jgi:hypothetical protein
MSFTTNQRLHFTNPHSVNLTGPLDSLFQVTEVKLTGNLQAKYEPIPQNEKEQLCGKGTSRILKTKEHRH